MMEMWYRLRAAVLRVRSAWRGWAALATLLVLLWWAFGLPWPSDAELRLSVVGMVLQLLGVGTVAIGIGQTRKLLKKPPILGGIWGHITGLFKKPQNIVLVAGTGELKLTGGAVSATVAHGALTTSLEDRVKRLETELNTQAGRLTELKSQIQAEAAAREQAINGEQNARAEADRELRQVLEDVQTGGVLLTVAGLTWLVFGIVLTSVAHWLSGFAVVG
jgi:hypothetical protein